MQLFKTEMFILYPPQTGAYRGRRRRYGCRTVPTSLAAQPLTEALRQVLAAVSARPSGGYADPSVGGNGVKTHVALQ